MILRGIDFGHVLNASGARNLTGRGYWYHQVWRPLGLNYTDSTFVAKTTTLEPRAGNMLLQEDGETPQEWFPRCIVVKPVKGVVLNAVGLSGPGLPALLATGRWQQRREPFFLSLASVGATAADRQAELRHMIKLLVRSRPSFGAPFGLQLNFSCPNTGHELNALVREVVGALAEADQLGVPLVPKLNALVDPSIALKIARHPACDALCMSNTIPWGQLPHRIDWVGLFGSTTSPLAQLGGGGLSGWPLLPIVRDWIWWARRLDFPKPIIACGGILSPAAAEYVVTAGASAIELGSVSLLRPWRVQGVIRWANQSNHTPEKLFSLTSKIVTAWDKSDLPA